MQSDETELSNEEKPLNVRSIDDELIAREMSNFEESPFELDGRKFQSIEAFYVWLKFYGDEENRTRAMTLYGAEAKSFGRKAPAEVIEYDGTQILLGSDAHHGLIKRAISAKLFQYPDIARRFAATHPRPIIHEFGKPERASRFPAAVFTGILTDLRESLVTGTLETKDGPVSKLAAEAAARENRQPKLPISEQLLRLEGRPSVTEHPIKRYAQVLEDSGIVVSFFLGAGADHIAFVTPDNLVLKITTNVLPESYAYNQFFLHIFERQKTRTSFGFKLQLYKQPRGERPQVGDLYTFNKLINRLGWVLADGGLEQLSIYNGGIKLHDPYAAYKMPERPGSRD